MCDCVRVCDICQLPTSYGVGVACVRACWMLGYAVLMLKKGGTSNASPSLEGKVLLVDRDSSAGEDSTAVSRRVRVGSAVALPCL